MLPESKTHRPLGYRVLVAAAYLGLGAGALVAAFLYVSAERVFYYWDSFAYNRAALGSLDAFHHSFGSWLTRLHDSIQNGFSEVYTILLAPLMAVVGESRATFIVGIVGFYLLPFAAVCTLLVRSLMPRLTPAALLLTFCACLSVPAIWHASLIGYPDVGGLTLAWLAILVYFSDRSLERWSSVAAIGLLLAGTFLFRRHLVYVVMPLLALMGLFSLGAVWRSDPPSRRWRFMLLIGKFAVIALLFVGGLALLAPDYLRELAATSYRDLYKPFQNPVPLAAAVHFHWVGLLYWVAGAAGFSLVLRDPEQRWKAAFLMGYTLGSFGIWALYLRYTSIQHNLHFSGMVACGVGALVAWLGHAPRTPLRQFFAPLCAIALLAVIWADRFAFCQVVPAAMERVLPPRVPPRVDLEYDSVRRLTDYLHGSVIDRGQIVLFDSSSILMNSDMISIAEQSLYGRRKARLNILYGGHMDTVASYPLRDMLAADWIVHTTPFQSHLGVKDQGVVEAIYRAFADDWEISHDFEVMPESFGFQHDTTVTIYRRIRETAFPTCVATARRIFDVVGYQDSWNGRWMLGFMSGGAEYYDARILHPKTKPLYTADFEQVRMRLDQSNLVLFVRVIGGKPSRISGRLTGSSGRQAALRADFYPDQDAPPAATWSQELNLKHGQRFEYAPPTTKAGILALTLTPDGKPPSGRPLGVVLDDLLVNEE